MLALGEAGLIPFIASIGLFRTKAKNVVALSRILVEQYGGEVPLEREALQALPGVGRKTASVVLNELGVEPAIAVDTHVFRVAHRLKLSKGKTPEEVEHDLMAIIARRRQEPRPPLADPARPLRLRRQEAQVRRVPPRRSLPLAGAVPGSVASAGTERGEAARRFYLQRSRRRRGVRREHRCSAPSAPAPRPPRLNKAPAGAPPGRRISLDNAPSRHH